jgi:uncharacterized protein YjiS (DUF1127 family)
MRTLQALMDWLRQWNRGRATVRTLRALPDWQLRDLGLTRDQITTVVDVSLGMNRRGKRSIATRPRIRPQAVPSGSGGKAITT